MKHTSAELKAKLKDIKTEPSITRKVLNAYEGMVSDYPPKIGSSAGLITVNFCLRCDKMLRSSFEEQNKCCNICLGSDWECPRCHGMLTAIKEISDGLCWKCKRGETADYTCSCCHKIDSEGTFRVFEGKQQWVCDICFVGPKYKKGQYFLDTSSGVVEVDPVTFRPTKTVLPLAEQPKFYRWHDGTLRKVVRVVARSAHVTDKEWKTAKMMPGGHVWVLETSEEFNRRINAQISAVRSNWKAAHQGAVEV